MSHPPREVAPHFLAVLVRKLAGASRTRWRAALLSVAWKGWSVLSLSETNLKQNAVQLS